MPRLKPTDKRVFAVRNKRIAIRVGAVKRLNIKITYVKVTTGEKKEYEISPISYRYERLRSGYRKVLYGYDKNDDRQLKKFVLRNISRVELTKNRYKEGKYPIEIK